ncbi:MAG: acyl-CoA thioesterase [Bacteroidales bacterium]|nr:acyl-CoA thioesterase [Bacteroidales bacterium]
MYFETSFPVRYYETDQMGVVHHSNYIRYFEVARNAMIAEAGYPIERCEKDGVVIPVIGVECRFRLSARMGDVLTVSAAIDSVPLAKLVIRQVVKNQRGEVCAEGSVTLGFLDSSTYRPVRCPAPLVEIIEKNT